MRRMNLDLGLESSQANVESNSSGLEKMEARAWRITGICDWVRDERMGWMVRTKKQAKTKIAAGKQYGKNSTKNEMNS